MPVAFSARPVVTVSLARRWLITFLAIILASTALVASNDTATASDSELEGFDEVCGAAPDGELTLSDVRARGPHADSIQCMARYGIIQGQEDGTFHPKDRLSRGQMASMLARFMVVANPDLEPPAAAAPFTDVRSSVHQKSILYLYAFGITVGVSETEYQPDAAISRGQMATFLLRTLETLGAEFDRDSPYVFRDVPRDHPHAQAIETLASAGIIRGTSAARFAPDDVVERQQAASLLLRSALDLHSRNLWEPTRHEDVEPPTGGHEEEETHEPTEPEPEDTHGSDGSHDHGPDDSDHAHEEVPDIEVTGPLSPWSDPATWPSGRVPTADDDVVVDGNVLLDRSADVRTITIRPGGSLELAPDNTVTLQSRGNVIVEGVLRMRPSSHSVVHTLRFLDVDEFAFQGGHTHHPLDTDVGLWVVGGGILDLVGTDREAWNRTGASPTWRSGDEIRVAPTAMGDSTTFATFTPGQPVPTVAGPMGTHTAEVMNLTRNVRIQGTGDGSANPANNGRAHIMLIGNQPQTIRNVELRHLGPRQPSAEFTQGVDGRYPLHMHKMGDAARGSVIEGVVIRQSGHRGFVIHHSHGVTLDHTIVYDSFDQGYWWDHDTRWTYPANASHDVKYVDAVAALIKSDPPFRGFGLGGFELGQGERNACIRCVAVGVQGNNNSAGFVWSEHAPGPHHVWTFVDAVAHNNRTNGILVWQNTGELHQIERFVGYRNGKAGVDHGAYVNNYQYRDLVLFENGQMGVMHHAQTAMQTAHGDTPITWSNLHIAGDVGFLAFRNQADEPVPVRIVGGNWDTDKPVVIRDGRDSNSPSRYDFVRVRNRGVDLQPSDFTVESMTPGSVFRVQRTDGTAFEVTTNGVSTIAPFAP
jgi:hypothetical protein